MSMGHPSDLRNTEAELENRSDLVKGKNWLRHTGQALRIDEMLLSGATNDEMAHDLVRKGLFTKGVDAAKHRVQRHIEHLRNEEHMLPLTQERNGIWRFTAKATSPSTIVNSGVDKISTTPEDSDDIKI